MVDKLSEPVLKSSSSDNDPFDSVSSLSDHGQTQFWTKKSWQMLRSKKKVDRKLLYIFSLKKNLVQDYQHDRALGQ